MKVIKYGKNNERKRATCKHCKSVIEYVYEEVNVDCFRELVSEDVYPEKQQQDVIITEEYSVKCPVCGHDIVVYEERARVYRH